MLMSWLKKTVLRFSRNRAKKPTTTELKQLILDRIKAQQQQEQHPDNYDVKSSLYALSSLYSLVESAQQPASETVEQSLRDYIELILNYQEQYRKNPLDSDKYGGGAAVIGSVVSRVIESAREAGIEL